MDSSAALAIFTHPRKIKRTDSLRLKIKQTNKQTRKQEKLNSSRWVLYQQHVFPSGIGNIKLSGTQWRKIITQLWDRNCFFRSVQNFNKNDLVRRLYFLNSQSDEIEIVFVITRAQFQIINAIKSDWEYTNWHSHTNLSFNHWEPALTKSMVWRNWNFWSPYLGCSCTKKPIFGVYILYSDQSIYIYIYISEKSFLIRSCWSGMFRVHEGWARSRTQ